MPGFSHWPELFIILILALIFFGPSKLPEVGSSIGKAMREFRRATSELEDAVLHHDAPEDFQEDDTFPHVPPSPDVVGESIPTPTIDTLAKRRAMRQESARASVTATAVDDEPGTPG